MGGAGGAPMRTLFQPFSIFRPILASSPLVSLGHLSVGSSQKTAKILVILRRAVVLLATISVRM